MRFRRYAAIGAAGGLAGGLLGIGGGFLMVPLQVLWAHVPQRRAGGNSLAAIVAIAVFAAGTYYFGPSVHQLDPRIAVAVMVGSSLGSLGGSLLSRRAPERALELLLVGLMLVGTIKEAHDAILGSGPAALGVGGAQFDALHYVLLAVAGAAIGALSGLTGVGGGILLVPTLVLGFGIGQRIAQGTSLLAILPTAAIGAAVHRRSGDLDVHAAAWLALGGVPASVLGAAVAQWLPQRALAGLFAVLLAAMAFRMLRRALGGGPTRAA